MKNIVLSLGLEMESVKKLTMLKLVIMMVEIAVFEQLLVQNSARTVLVIMVV